MKQPTPKIDPRTAPDIFRQVVELLNQTKVGLSPGSGWGAFQPGEGTSAALIKIFARFAELITDRLNRAPEKNFLAFLDLLGASLLPPRPARAPLTFSIVESTSGGAVVGAGTEVAAKATEGEREPAVFETERELVVTSSKLAAAFTRDPLNDLYVDHAPLLSRSGAGESKGAVFQGVIPIDHILYIAHDRIFNHPDEKESIAINLTLAGQGNLKLAWDGWDKERRRWVEKNRGEITGNARVDLTPLDPSPPMVVGGTRKRWLRCRLIGASRQEMTLSDIKLSAKFARKERGVEKAFTNSLPVDASRGFYPFGETPTAGDVFYVRLDGDFAEPGCKVTLKPALVMVGQAPTVEKPRNPKVVWEFWNGAVWTAIDNVSDKTDNFTTSAEVTFPFPEKSALASVNGVEGHWVRTRLSSGSYGPKAALVMVKAPVTAPVSASTTADKLTAEQYTYESIPAAAPLISSIKLDYETTLTAEQPEAVLAYDDFKYVNRDTLEDKTRFVLFRVSQEKNPAFYLGFEAPAGLGRMPNSKINIYIGATGEIDPNDRAEIEWQYSTTDGKSGWAPLSILDATDDFTRSGVVEFLAPTDFAPRAEFGSTLYWLRAVRKSGKYTTGPLVSSLLLNTVMARHATRIENEVLGSSDGSKSQTFRTSLAPVLEGQRLEVREMEVPSPMEQDAIKKEAGEDAILIVADESGRPLKIWVRWTEVPDFYASGPRDRHYVLDHQTGEVRFGDGISAMVPPVGSGNIRMATYRTGGGSRGNKPAGAITELRTTVAYVEGVTNHVAASGGAEAETYEALVERMPRTIRHGGRAVTYEDYEDLAMAASPEVARARCVRIYEPQDVGKVLLIVVPRSADPKPVPSLEMKRRVQEFIEQKNPPLVQLTVAGPKYVEVNVAVDIAPTSLEVASEVKSAVLEQLNIFLHPLVGGFDGEGWGFGREPHKSDLYYLIEAIPGVDHVTTLDMKTAGEISSEQHLIASGKHEVSCKF